MSSSKGRGQAPGLGFFRHVVVLLMRSPAGGPVLAGVRPGAMNRSIHVRAAVSRGFFQTATGRSCYTILNFKLVFKNVLQFRHLRVKTEKCFQNLHL
jgi:hypothetical protein